MTDEILSLENVRIIVPGTMMTDISVVGLPNLPTKGVDTYGTGIRIGGGGKSRNIAEMAGRLTRPGTVASITYTTRDRHGLWEPPYMSLIQAGVNTRYVLIDDNANGNSMPSISLISVDEHGNRQSSISPGLTHMLTPAVIQNADQLFVAAEHHFGVLVLSLEMPFETAIFAAQLARDHKLRVIVDPGGISPEDDYKKLLEGGIYLIKPNEVEVLGLTGIQVTDSASAEQAAAILLGAGAANVLITHAEQGAYLFGEGDTKLSIPTPQINLDGPTDATGCGDQVLATLVACLEEGRTLDEAAKIAIAAGTLQFHRQGAQPITWDELSQTVPISPV
jgi:ribokinase